MSPVLTRNIDTLHRRRREEAQTAGPQQRIADTITRFAGSMAFIYIHIVLFGFWIVANVGWIPDVPVWDSSFVILGTGASVEAIFLSTFVLISQNRMAATADKRADLDLQIGLLSEHEVTRLIALVSAIAEHLRISTDVDQELAELKRDVAPEVVLDEIEEKRP